MGAQKEKKVSNTDVLKEAEDQLKRQKEKKSKGFETPDQKENSKKNKNKKGKKRKIRSRKYQESYTIIDRAKKYKLDEAIELVKRTSYSKFDGSVELHIKIAKSGKKVQPIRKLINLPHGTGKKLKIVILNEDIINEISKSKKIGFDICLASPQIMPKLARIAKILGPKGKMPNPKSGTITTEPEKTKQELETGKIEIKEDASGIIHQIVGKISWSNEKIKENSLMIIKNIPVSNLQSITLCATMGPGIKIVI